MVTASIVIHKSPPEQIKRALGSLLISPVDKIYVIDNSPTDSLQNSVKINSKIFYYHTANKGFGAGHNIAIKKSIEEGSEFHLVMNPDVYWDKDPLEPLLKELRQNSEIGIIAPKVLNPDGSIQFSCRMLPTPWDLFCKRFIPSKFSSKRMSKYLLKDYGHDVPINCPYLLGSFMLFRTKAIKDCGAFDERFFLYPEDIDISRRFHIKWSTVYWPYTHIFHEHQAASQKNIRMFLIHFVNMIRYFNKWGWWIDPLRKKINYKLSLQLGRKCSSPDNLK